MLIISIVFMMASLPQVLYSMLRHGVDRDNIDVFYNQSETKLIHAESSHESRYNNKTPFAYTDLETQETVMVSPEWEIIISEVERKKPSGFKFNYMLALPRSFKCAAFDQDERAVVLIGGLCNYLLNYRFSKKGSPEYLQAHRLNSCPEIYTTLSLSPDARYTAIGFDMNRDINLQDSVSESIGKIFKSDNLDGNSVALRLPKDHLYETIKRACSKQLGKSISDCNGHGIIAKVKTVSMEMPSLHEIIALVRVTAAMRYNSFDVPIQYSSCMRWDIDLPHKQATLSSVVDGHMYCSPSSIDVNPPWYPQDHIENLSLSYGDGKVLISEERTRREGFTKRRKKTFSLIGDNFSPDILAGAHASSVAAVLVSDEKIALLKYSNGAWNIAINTIGDNTTCSTHMLEDGIESDAFRVDSLTYLPKLKIFIVKEKNGRLHFVK